MERDDHRLEEIAKNYMTFGKLTHLEYLEKIDAVTSEQINRCATLAMSKLPTVVAIGSAINEVPSVTEISKMIS